MKLTRLFPEPLSHYALHPGGPAVIAGPCSAESAAQTLAVAEALHRGGVRIFRAGVWKPRTRPGGFEGMGLPALDWLRKVRLRTGMLTLTEVATPAHLRAAAGSGVDGVWIGARTTANPFAVQELADAFAAMPQRERERLAVLVKNPVSPDLELWIGALTRLNLAGVTRLGAIHRGFMSATPGPYRNEPVWRIPIELRRRFPELPLFFDPSHTGGAPDMIEPLSTQALNVGCDGLIVEVHENPSMALSDAAQQVTPEFFLDLVARLRHPDAADPKDELTLLRAQIDALDSQLLEVLAQRQETAQRIGRLKRRAGMAVVQPQRYAGLIRSRIEEAAARNLDPVFVQRLLTLIHEESVRRQLKDLDKPLQ